MSGMILQYNAPEIYILGTTNKIQELNMDGLFVSPAGRELMKQKSQYHHKTKMKTANNDFRKTLPTISLLSETSLSSSHHQKTSQDEITLTMHPYTNRNLYDDTEIGVLKQRNNTTAAATTTDTNDNHVTTINYNTFPSAVVEKTHSYCSQVDTNILEPEHSLEEISNPPIADHQSSTSSTSTIIEINSNATIADVHDMTTFSSQSSRSVEKKTAEEYYEEELELLLGLNCVLEDDCRCFDCQSSYFDYTEDDDLDENIESIKSFNESCRRHHTNHTTNMYCCIQ